VVPSRFRQQTRREVIKADPVAAELRAQRESEHRQVAKRAEPDGQASMYLNGPAPAIETIWTALDVLAAKTSMLDGRTLDQRRFDALAELCARALAEHAAGGQPPARPGARACVYVYADAATWAGLADQAGRARRLRPHPRRHGPAYFSDATWRAVVTDTITGMATAVSDRSYTPSARTQRHLHARDRTCGFPGCTAAVWFCDADHNTPHASGGATDTRELRAVLPPAPPAQDLHRLDLATPPDGTLQWTDPNGRTWHRDPIRYPMPERAPSRRPDKPVCPRHPAARRRPTTRRRRSDGNAHRSGWITQTLGSQ
jgi:hypothetical protein